LLDDVPVGGGDDAGINGDVLSPPNALDGFFL